MASWEFIAVGRLQLAVRADLVEPANGWQDVAALKHKSDWMMSDRS